MKRQNKNRPFLRFQAGCRKRQLNLTLVFLRLFCVVVYLFWLVNVCFCCVRFSFSILSQDMGVGNVSEITFVKWDSRKAMYQLANLESDH